MTHKIARTVNHGRQEGLPMTTDEVLESLVEEGRVDHVGLWEIVRAVREDLGVSDAAEARRTTVDLIGALLCDHGMPPGRPTPDGRGFLPWQLSPKEAISRIEKEWLALGREPTIGEIVWFDTPDASGD